MGFWNLAKVTHTIDIFRYLTVISNRLQESWQPISYLKKARIHCVGWYFRPRDDCKSICTSFEWISLVSSKFVEIFNVTLSVKLVTYDYNMIQYLPIGSSWLKILCRSAIVACIYKKSILQLISFFKVVDNFTDCDIKRANTWQIKRAADANDVVENLGIAHVPTCKLIMTMPGVTWNLFK